MRIASSSRTDSILYTFVNIQYIKKKSNLSNCQRVKLRIITHEHIYASHMGVSPPNLIRALEIRKDINLDKSLSVGLILCV